MLSTRSSRFISQSFPGSMRGTGPGPEVPGADDAAAPAPAPRLLASRAGSKRRKDAFSGRPVSRQRAV